MKYLVSLLLFVFAACPAPVFSQVGDLPQAGAFDRRMRFIDYNAEAVTRLVFHVGFAMEIVFDSEESVEPEAWTGVTSAYNITSLGNSVVIRATKVAPTTNLYLRTNKRGYWFDFIQAPIKPLDQSRAVLDDPDLVYRLRFRYPIQEFTNSLLAGQASLAVAQAQKQAELAKLQQTKTPAQVSDVLSFAGHESLKPIRATTRERLTVLEFSSEQVIPSIYIAGPDGTEMQAQRSMLGPTEVGVHHVGRAIILRAGKAVGAVFNERFMSDVRN